MWIKGKALCNIPNGNNADQLKIVTIYMAL